ncbi:MAG: hypothetical protein J6Y78_01655 [Paludibacteraceae bacterium]|nr:hypothetical protein [Paludibacteraceae bacterium]
MGKVMSYERALQVHKEWKEVQARKKARKEEQERRRQEEIRKAAEIRKKREKKLEEERLKKQQKEEEYQWKKDREIEMDDWILYDTGALYSKYEMLHLDELYPNEKGRLSDRFWELIEIGKKEICQKD